MSLSSAVTAIRARAESLWPGLEPDVPLAWPNEAFEKPIDSSTKGPLPFVMIETRWSGGEFVSIGSPGSNLARREGHIWIFAFIGQATGEGRAHQLIAEASGMFEGADFSGVVCQASEPGGDTRSDDGNYFGQAAAVPFNFDETA